MCPVVTIRACKVGGVYSEEYPDGCDNCEMLNWWSAFKSEIECNAAYFAQNSDDLEIKAEFIKKYS